MPGEATRRDVVVLAILFVLCVWSVSAELTNARAFHYYCNDDAYISFTYAKNLLSGHGLVFNPGERVEGYTNFLWLMFLVPWMKLLPNIDISHIAIAWGAFFSAGVILLTFYLGMHGKDGQDAHPAAQNLIAPALLSMDNTFHYWSISGLENAMQAVLILTSFVFVFRSTSRSLLYAGLCFALATMARPDSGLFWAVSVGALVLQALKSRISLREPVMLVAGFLAVMVPYCAWKLYYYGNILPNTFYLHTGNRALRIARGQSYFLTFLQNRFYLPLLSLVTGFSGYSFRKSVLLLSVVSFSGYVIWMGGDFFPGSRFLYVLLPLIYLMIQDAILFVSTRLASGKIVAAALTVGIAAAALYGSYGTRGEYQDFVLVWAKDDLQRIQLAKDLGTIRKEGDSILSGPIGQIGYYSGMKVLDYWGVIDPHIARRKVLDAGGGTPGHEKSDIAYLLARKPTYILFGVDPRNPPDGYFLREIAVENRKWIVLQRVTP